MNTKLAAKVSTVACFILGIAACHADYKWNERVIFYGYHGVHPPSLYDGQIAWASDPSNDIWYEDLFFWDGSDVTQLTDDPWAHEGSPSLYDGRIAYRTDPEGIMQIGYWGGQGEDPYQVTFGDEKRGLPSLYGNRIAYASKESETDWDIYYYDCVTEQTVRVSDSEWYDFYAVAYEDTIAWISGTGGNEYDMYYWDGETTEPRVMPSRCAMWKPSLYDGQIAWAEVSGYGADATIDIMLWDVATDTKIQVTATDVRDVEPSLFMGKMAYTSFDGSDWEIWFWDGNSHWQVTDDSYINRNPSLYITETGEIQIAYVRYTDWDVYEGEIVYLTDYHGAPTPPEPSTIAVVFSGVALFLWRFRRRSRY